MSKIKRMIVCTLYGALALVVLFIGFTIYHFNFVVTRPRAETPFAEGHARAVHTFVSGKDFGIHRFREREYFFEHSMIFDGEVWELDDLFLVGTSREFGDRYYVGFTGSYVRKSDLGEENPRPLEIEEREAIHELRETKKDWVVLDDFFRRSGDLKRRIFAPIRAQEGCLKCHDAEVGDLLGAFDYHLEREKPERSGGQD